MKTCKARIETNDAIVVAEYGGHDHFDKVSNVAAVALRVCCKRNDENVALLKLQVAVLLILHLRFCYKYICVFMAILFALS